MLRAGLRYGGRLRARYTVVDFLEGQGIIEDALDARPVVRYQRPWTCSRSSRS